MKVSFVIPTYGKYELVHQVLFDIYKKCSKPYEIIVMDDCSPQGDIIHDGVAWWVSNGLMNVHHVVSKSNVGFLRNSNEGLKRATGDIVILISNDVRIYSDISKNICSVLDNNSKSLVGGRLLDFDTGWNTFGDKIFPYVEGWLLATTKIGWKSIGYFDERYAPFDFEDVDLSTKAISLGYTLHPLSESDTHHIGAQSIKYGSEREEQTKKNRKKFEEKWVTKVNP